MRRPLRSLRALELPLPALLVLALCLRTQLAKITPWFPLLFWATLVAVVILAGRYFVDLVRLNQKPPFIVWASLVMALDIAVLYAAGSSIEPAIVGILSVLFYALWLGVVGHGMLGVGVENTGNRGVGNSPVAPEVVATPILTDDGAIRPRVSGVVPIHGNPSDIEVYKRLHLGKEVAIGGINRSGRSYRIDGPNQKTIDWTVDDNGLVWLIYGEARAPIGSVDEKGNVYAEHDHPVSGLFTGEGWFYGPPTYAPGLIFQVSEDGTVCSVKGNKTKIIGRVEGTSDVRIIGALALVLLNWGL